VNATADAAESLQNLMLPSTINPISKVSEPAGLAELLHARASTRRARSLPLTTYDGQAKLRSDSLSPGIRPRRYVSVPISSPINGGVDLRVDGQDQKQTFARSGSNVRT
jgi:hypothetical protein